MLNFTYLQPSYIIIYTIIYLKHLNEAMNLVNKYNIDIENTYR